MLDPTLPSPSASFACGPYCLPILVDGSESQKGAKETIWRFWSCSCQSKPDGAKRKRRQHRTQIERQSLYTQTFATSVRLRPYNLSKSLSITLFIGLTHPLCPSSRLSLSVRVFVCIAEILELQHGTADCACRPFRITSAALFDKQCIHSVCTVSLYAIASHLHGN